MGRGEKVIHLRPGQITRLKDAAMSGDLDPPLSKGISKHVSQRRSHMGQGH